MGRLKEERSRRGLKTTLDAGISMVPCYAYLPTDQIVRQTDILHADTQVPELTLALRHKFATPMIQDDIGKERVCDVCLIAYLNVELMQSSSAPLNRTRDRQAEISAPLFVTRLKSVPCPSVLLLHALPNKDPLASRHPHDRLETPQGRRWTSACRRSVVLRRASFSID